MLELDPKFHPPNIPIIGYNSMSSNAEKIQHINELLEELSQNCKEFSCCVALFQISQTEYSKESKLFWEKNRRSDKRAISLHRVWTTLAARSGALALRNYRKTLGAIQRFSGQIDAIRTHTDLKIVRTARRRFDTYFPNIDILRDSVAHPEAYNDPDQSSNLPTGESVFHPSDNSVPIIANYGAKIIIRDGIIGTKYTTTFNGKLLSYEASTESVLELIEITNDCFTAFLPISWTTEQPW